MKPLASPFLDPHKPLYPQLVPGVPMWSDGKRTVQQYVRPGPEWFPVAVLVKEAA